MKKFPLVVYRKNYWSFMFFSSLQNALNETF